MHTTISGLYKNVTSGIKSRLLDLYGKYFYLPSLLPGSRDF